MIFFVCVPFSCLLFSVIVLYVISVTVLYVHDCFVCQLLPLLMALALIYNPLWLMA